MALIDNLVSYWKLDEASGTRADSHGSNNLTDNNTVTSTTGKIGNAALFNAVDADNEYLSKSSPSSIPTGSGDRTIAGWINFSALRGTDSYQTIFSSGVQSVGNDEFTFVVWENGSGNEYLAVDRYGARQSSNDIVASTSTWYHVAVVMSSSNLTFYLNGSAHGTATGGTYNTVATSTLQIGKRFADTGSDFRGYIEELGVWSKALTSDEITDLYNSGSGLAYPFSTTSIKTINGLSLASVKTVNGLAIASVKTVNGLA